MQQPCNAMPLAPTCPTTDGTPTSYALASRTQHKRGARHYNVHRLLHKLHTKFVVSWLLQTYRLSDNCSPVLKSQVYQEYVGLCQEKNLMPIHNSGTASTSARFSFSFYLLFPHPPAPHTSAFFRLQGGEKTPYLCATSKRCTGPAHKKKHASASLERCRL